MTVAGRVDGCEYSFQELTTTVLPRLMAELRKSMQSPLPLDEFAVKGHGVKSLLRDHGLSEDFPGCYVLMDRDRPVYVGISRKVFTRLRQHVLADTHNSATLAYRIAAAHTFHGMRRGEAMRDPAFRRAFDDAQEYLRGLQVAYVRIDNPLVLHVFEAYAALELGTAEWNTFETH